MLCSYVGCLCCTSFYTEHKVVSYFRNKIISYEQLKSKLVKATKNKQKVYVISYS